MKLTFTNENLKKLWAAAEANWPNGTVPNYVQHCDGDKNPPRGFWIVGDSGVYLMHNGKTKEGDKNVVVYAEECNPDTCDDWWEVKRATFGGDDGVDFIEALPIKHAIDKGAWLEFTFTPDSMVMNTVWKEGKK